MEERIIKDLNNLLTQLFQKMKEAGYEWDAEKKELKKIEQKAAWSEEDESWFKELELMALSFSNDESYLKKFFDWLKFLKERGRPKRQWKPTEAMLEALKWAKSEFHPDCIDTMDNLNHLYKEIEQLYNDRT